MDATPPWSRPVNNSALLLVDQKGKKKKKHNSVQAENEKKDDLLHLFGSEMSQEADRGRAQRSAHRCVYGGWQR